MVFRKILLVCGVVVAVFGVLMCCKFCFEVLPLCHKIKKFNL